MNRHRLSYNFSFQKLNPTHPTLQQFDYTPLTYPRSFFQFDYTSPERGFDRRKVKGLVADLFTIPDTTYAMALEVAAGWSICFSIKLVFFPNSSGKDQLKLMRTPYNH